MKRSALLLSGSLLLPGALGCAASDAAPEEAQVCNVALPADDPELAAAIADGWFFRWVLPRLDGASAEVAAVPAAAGCIAVGRWPLPAALAALAAPLPLGGDEATVRLAGDRYAADEVVLAARLPRSAGQPGPRWVVAGRDPRALSELVSEVLRWELAGSASEKTDFVVRENPWMERSGAWRRGALGWEVDPDHDRDGFAERRAWLDGLVPLGGDGLQLLVPPAERRRPELARLASELDAAVAAMAPRLPLPAAALDPPLRVALEDDFVRQARHAADLGEAVPGSLADLHLVFDPRDRFAYRVAVADRLIERARSADEVPLPPWLRRGAALWLAGAEAEWFGRPWRQWLPVLAAAGGVPEPGELAAGEERGDSSPPLTVPWAAAVIDALPGATLAAKLSPPPAAERVEALLARAVAEARAAAEGQGAGTVVPVSSPALPGFLRGVSFAMLNSLEGGYHAPAADGRLAHLAELGADAVSLMPFAGQRGPHEPALRFYDDSPASETAVGLVHAARRAHARGFTVLWKPQLWISHDSWPGEVAMESEEDWQTWWRAYRRFVLHHALLAAWADSELFSVGVELTETLGREAEWRRLIADVRRLYPGVVTYSANWYALEKVAFWDALDLIGVDAYYPLAESAEATPAELAAGARRAVSELARTARHHEKRLLLTEVGFAARRGAWIDPHAEGGELSEADQAVAYGALLDALDHPPWLAGAFFWKAFSAQVPRLDGQPDFRFLGRPAEAEIRRWFAEAATAETARSRRRR